MNSLDKSSAKIYASVQSERPETSTKQVRNVPRFYSVFLGHPISLAVTLKSDITMIIAISLLQLMNIFLKLKVDFVTLQTRTVIGK